MVSDTTPTWICRDCNRRSPNGSDCLLHLAAPDLLEACKAFIGLASKVDMSTGLLPRDAWDNAWHLTLAAIAKAEGGQP